MNSSAATTHFPLVDCDVHVEVNVSDLAPYMTAHWRDMVEARAIGELETTLYPPSSPLTFNERWGTNAKSSVAEQQREMDRVVFGEFGADLAICSSLYGVQLLRSEDMAVGYAQALNDWFAKEWLDKDSRVRGSIVIPMQNPELAAQEIERLAADRRFVQVLMVLLGEVPLGNRHYWPIYAAAERHDFPIAIHSGTMGRHPVTGTGWHSSLIQEHFAQMTGFQTQLTSLVCEGVFSKFPKLKVVFSESGFSWLPAYTWRLDKTWTSLRMEVPWVDRPPSEIIRSNVRFTLQPLEAPLREGKLQQILEQIGSDELILYSSDYPHKQFDGAPLPDKVSESFVERIGRLNPQETYGRLRIAS